MKRIVLLFLLFFLFAGLAGSAANGQARWKLDFTFELPRSIILPNKAGRARTVWYMLYRVANRTGEDRRLGSIIKATTDSGKTYWDLPDPLVEKAVKDKFKKKKLFNSVSIRGTVKDGETRDGIAILGDVDRQMDVLTIHVSGLVDVITMEGGKTYFEKKVLNLIFKRPGDEYYVQRDQVKFVKKKWMVVGGKRKLN